MTREMVFQLVKAKVLEVLVDVDPAAVTPEVSLTELGANSVDRVEVSMAVLEELDLLVDCATQSLYPRQADSILAEIE